MALGGPTGVVLRAELQGKERSWAAPGRAGNGRKTGLSWDEGFWAGLGFLFFLLFFFSNTLKLI